MNNDEQKRFKATNPKVSDVQAFKQILERALTPHATNSLDRFNELKAFVQGPVTRLNGFPITTNPLQATRLAKLDPEIGKHFKSTLNNRLHRNLACVIDKSSRGAKLERAFEELP